MESPIQLVIPMSGKGSRFKKAGYLGPKPLISVNGVPMIQRMLEFFPKSWEATFILSKDDEASPLEGVLRTLRPTAKIIYIEAHSLGPGAALEKALPHLDSQRPVLVSYCDYGMKWNPVDFEKYVVETQCDACLVSYRGFHAHYLSPTPYAYSRMLGEQVKEVKEKGSFTQDRENEYASAGAYFFKNAALLSLALEKQKQLQLIFNGEYYTSLTIEALLRVLPEANVRVYEIAQFFQWGTPEDLADFEYWEKTFQAKIKFSESKQNYVTSQVLMPMAGQGSRFKDLFSIPKPFMEWGAEPMFKKALRSLPQAQENYFVLLKEHKIYFDQVKNATEAPIYLSQTPQGQALSVEAALPSLKKGVDLIVSACDHEIVLNPEDWAKFRKLQIADAAIFTIKNFPGARRNPESFAYVELDASPKEDKFRKIKFVSVKKTLTATPWKDSLLVGTFWFRDKSVLEKGIALLKACPHLINNELYLDSVFNELIKAGLTVCELPLAGYIGWGDPDSLAEALYWEQVYLTNKSTNHSRFSEISR